MTDNEVRRRLEKRFYEWALNDAQREVAEDFPFLRRVAWSLPIKVVSIMRSLPMETRQQLGSALVRTHKVRFTAEKVATMLTAADDQILSWYHEQIRQDNREVLEAHSLERWATYTRDKRKLMSTVRDELMLVFPGQASRKSKSELHFYTSVHGFEIETTVYTGNTWQLWYYHNLRHVPSGVDVERISLMKWLGISTPTYWYYITEATIPDAAKAVGDLCRHFLAAADQFLAGLIEC